MSTNEALLRVRGLVKSHRSRGLPEVEVLTGLALDVSAGALIAVMGASGSGKSTLLAILGGMLAPDSGHVGLAGEEPWRMTPDLRAAWRNSQVGFVFQFHHLLAELNAVENVLAPARIAGDDEAASLAAATQLLEELGLGARLRHHPAELSGGEAQRVAIARALVRGPRLVLADEPTGNLDRGTGRSVFDQFVSLQRQQGFIALVATHDDGVARRCDSIYLLEGGRLSPATLE